MGRPTSESDFSENDNENSSGSDYVSPSASRKRKAKTAPKTRKKLKVEDKPQTRTVSARHSVSLHQLTGAAPMRVALLAWYDGVSTSRGMPWRKPFRPEATPDERAQRAYEVWVSEIMLQQTQVSTVIAYYNRWMAKFPTLVDLARASIDDVNALWKGLGYYSRAKRMLEGAQKAVKNYDGRLPDSAKEMQASIPGIGRYSAGAICSIAYGERVPVLDGNVHRLMSRVLALYANPKAKATLDLLWAAAEAMVMAPDPAVNSAPGRAQHAGDINQALIELGSTVCKVKDPDCEKCPLSPWCRAYSRAKGRDQEMGDIEDLCQSCEPLPDDTSVTIYPMRAERKKAREEVDAVNVIEWRGRELSQRFILLIRRPENGLLAGLYEFPTLENVSGSACPEAHTKKLLSLYLKDRVQSTQSGDDDHHLRLVSSQPKGDVLHIFSHVRKTYRVAHVVIQGGAAPPALVARPSQDRPSATPTPVKKGKAKGKEKGATAASASAPADKPAGIWTDIAKVSDANIGTGVGKIWSLIWSG
ncbi:DNA glycosylase [Schizophyllum fasciatum]